MGNDIIAVYSQSSLPCCQRSGLVGVHFGNGTLEKSLAGTGAFRLRNVQASASQRKKRLLAKLIAEEENMNVRREHVGEERT